MKDKGQKDTAAVALGRKGGLKGGAARARKLTAQQRSEIARGAAVARWSTVHKGGGEVVSKWRKKLTKSDAQEDTRGARMPFLRFTKGNTGEDHTKWFRSDFFSELDWKKVSGTKEEATVTMRVNLAGNDLGNRKMLLDHDSARASNHRAPTTHLHYDNKTRQELEKAKLSGRSVVVEHHASGEYSLTVF